MNPPGLIPFGVSVLERARMNPPGLIPFEVSVLERRYKGFFITLFWSIMMQWLRTDDTSFIWSKYLQTMVILSHLDPIGHVWKCLLSKSSYSWTEEKIIWVFSKQQVHILHVIALSIPSIFISILLQYNSPTDSSKDNFSGSTFSKYL